MSVSAELARRLEIALATTPGVVSELANAIATQSTSTLGFFGASPVVRPAAYTQTYSTVDKTHANPTAVALTDATGGTADQTVADVTASFSQSVLNNNFADIADEINKLVADVADVKQLLNSVVDDLQSLGLLQ